jgi:peptidoglycan/xylan/chitin deacetylase (PgdA/CDA1 family)
MFKKIIRKSLNVLDGVAVMNKLEVAGGCLIGVLFHSLHEGRSPTGHPVLAAYQSILVSQFRAFVEEMLELGFTIVSPAQIDAGLDAGGRYLAITFDDGYFNNFLALPVLEEFRVPASFFISTDHVETNKAFWWDAFGRELIREGIVGAQAVAELARPKAWRPAQIEAYLNHWYGPRCLVPRSDQDRPFNASELREFSRSPWVHLGNHTCAHAILTNCDAALMESELKGCQEALERMVGCRPIVVAYPNGNYSDQAMAVASACGLRVGFTVVPRRAVLPIARSDRMQIGRFAFYGDEDVRLQCHRFAARFVPSYSLRRLVQYSNPWSSRTPGQSLT